MRWKELKKVKMTEIEIETYIDEFLIFEQVCKQRKIRIYPDKEEYICIFTQEDILALWHTFHSLQCTKPDERLDALVKSNPLML